MRLLLGSAAVTGCAADDVLDLFGFAGVFQLGGFVREGYCGDGRSQSRRLVAVDLGALCQVGGDVFWVGGEWFDATIASPGGVEVPLVAVVAPGVGSDGLCLKLLDTMVVVFGEPVLGGLVGWFN